MPSLVIVDRQNTRTEVEIGLPFFTIGRSAACTVQIEDHGLSKRHARLYQTPDGYCVIDAGSKNGISVNGTKVDRALLRPGDHIRLGGVSIHWDAKGLIPGPPGSGPTAADDTHREKYGAERFLKYGGPLRLKAEEVDDTEPTEPPATPTADQPPLELAPPDPPTGAPVAEPAARSADPAAPAVGPAGAAHPAGRLTAPPTHEVPGELPLGALHVRGVTQRRTHGDLHPAPAAPSGTASPLAPAPTPAAPALDEVDLALARLRADSATQAHEPGWLSFVRAVATQAGAGVRAFGPRMLAASAVAAAVLVVMIVHARTVIDARWDDGPAVQPRADTDATDGEAAAAQMYREADDLRATRPDLADALLDRLAREHPDSGWADLARVRLAAAGRPGPDGSTPRAPGSDPRPSSNPDLAAEDASEKAYAAGRVGEAIEGLTRLAASARVRGDAARAQRLEDRLQLIEHDQLERFEPKAGDLELLAQAGEVDALARRATELLAQHPLPAVKRRLDDMLARAARPTPARVCRRLLALLLREDSDAAARLLEVARAEPELSSIDAEIVRLLDLVRDQGRLVAAADAAFRAAPVVAPAELGLPASARIAGWGPAGLVIQTGDESRALGWDGVGAAQRYGVLRDHSPPAVEPGDLAAYALLRDLGEAYVEASARARRADRGYLLRAAWIDPLAGWYRRMLR